MNIYTGSQILCNGSPLSMCLFFRQETAAMAPATKLRDSVSAIPVGQAQTATSIVQGFPPVGGKRGVGASKLCKTELLLSWQGEA